MLRRRPRYFPSLAWDELARVDRRLATLGRGLGAMRLRIGEGLLRLEGAGGVKALGFPDLESYCREALGRTGRWGADVRGLARRLATLPLLRAALVDGRLTSSMVELVVRVATPADEAAWVARACGMTVRAMRAELFRLRAETIDEDAPERVTITATVDRVDAWAFEQARMMVEAVGGVRGDGAIEAMLAEGLTEIQAQVPDVDLPWGLGPEALDEDRRFRAELRALREGAEAASEALTVVEAATYEVEPEIAWADDGVAIDAQLREAARALAWRDLELATLGRRAAEHGVWQTLGYASFDHYCRERVGIAPSAMSTRQALARRLVVLPEIEAALGQGRIGYEAAVAIARVASPGTAAAWVARAEARTVKLLREEVGAIEMLARAEGRGVGELPPPDAETLEALHGVERAVHETLLRGQMSGPEGPTEGGEMPQVQLRVTVEQDLGRMWREVERLYRALSPSATSFVGYLAWAVGKSWRGAAARDVAYEPIYTRDRWRCSSPICTRRNVTPHHVHFRSHGGSDAPENVIALCEACHLSLVHAGYLKVVGEAPHGLVWSAAGWAA